METQNFQTVLSMSLPLPKKINLITNLIQQNKNSTTQSKDVDGDSMIMILCMWFE